jgi:YggT family protein
MSLPAAIGRNDIADYVEALFLVYLILIFGAILISWIEALGRMPYNPYLRAVTGFIREVTNPYLNLFRRFIPPIGMFDLSPILAIIVLLIAQAVVVGLIRG